MGQRLTGQGKDHVAGEGLREARGRPASVLRARRRLNAVSGGGRRCRMMVDAVGLEWWWGWGPGPGGGGADLTGEERVDGVQPVVEVTVAASLDQVAAL